MLEATAKIKEKNPDAKVLAIYSFGAFVEQSGDEGYAWQELDYEDYQIRITTVLALIMLSFIIFLLFLIYMRKKLLDLAE